MARIGDADYETISVTCDFCHANLRLNRRDDLRELSAISGRNLTCSSCHREFWITGDIVNTPYEMFIFAADAHFESKHHMLAVMSLAQAWELFLATFAYSNFVYRPSWLQQRHAAAREELTRCEQKLEHATRNFNIRNLVNLTTHTIVRQMHPRTLAEAEPMIEQIEQQRLHRDPSNEDIATITDDEIHAAVQRLRNLQIVDLRNKVGHKQAYRPTAKEVMACIEEEIVFLHHIRDLFGVGDFDDFAADAVETPRWFQP
ncbi:MAG TPA: hypothetical protein VGF69_22060 [Thermoanaerobaculia bacterium]|jgi:hypothetical protein